MTRKKSLARKRLAELKRELDSAIKSIFITLDLVQRRIRQIAALERILRGGAR